MFWCFFSFSFFLIDLCLYNVRRKQNPKKDVENHTQIPPLQPKNWKCEGEENLFNGFCRVWYRHTITHGGGSVLQLNPMVQISFPKWLALDVDPYHDDLHGSFDLVALLAFRICLPIKYSHRIFVLSFFFNFVFKNYI